MSTRRTPLKVLAFATLLLGVTACGVNSSALPSTSPTKSSATPATSAPTEVPVDAQAELQTAVDLSLAEMSDGGVIDTYATEGVDVYVEVFDPNSAFDYKGVGIILELDETELVLELDMFALYTIAEPLSKFTVTDVIKNSDGTYSATMVEENMPDSIDVTVDDSGLISKMRFRYDDSASEHTVSIGYTITKTAAALIKRANEEFLASSP
jgi:hypothetical protein